MPSITVDPLPEEAFSGLKDPTALQRAFNRLQEECAVLNGRITAANLSKLVLAEKELVTPSEWVPLTLESGFAEADSTTYPRTAVRKQADGMVALRENIRRATGAPATFTRIAALPSAYAPESPGLRLALGTGGAVGSWKVVGQEIQWVTGDPTAQFAFCGGTWLAQDRSLPAWTQPFRIALPTARTGVVVREVLVVARSAKFDGYGVPVPCTAYKPTVERVPGQEQPVLSISRIDGLQPEQRYKLTLWAYTD